MASVEYNRGLRVVLKAVDDGEKKGKLVYKKDEKLDPTEDLSRGTFHFFSVNGAVNVNGAKVEADTFVLGDPCGQVRLVKEGSLQGFYLPESVKSLKIE